MILADPGAGKTFEALDRARRLRRSGEQAFFIRIEKIDGKFEDAFEVGTSAEFNAWLDTTADAWFFLDSVDEAQLATPRALDKAIRCFGARIRDARERCHIFITSREDAWQALPDRDLVEQNLPYGAPPTDDSSGNATSPSKDPILRVFRLAGLKRHEIELFAGSFLRLAHNSTSLAHCDAVGVGPSTPSGCFRWRR